MKKLAQKKPAKDQRERLVLLGLVELYLETGKPVGSQTLRDCGFETLSSATIRNYFARLEEAGYLSQQHSSGGRIPTAAAYKLYAQEHLHTPLLSDKEKDQVHSELVKETHEVTKYLQHAAETLSKLTQSAVFLSSPRFDQDFVLDVKIVPLDARRLLFVLMTNFGSVHTEVLHVDQKIGSFAAKRLEAYFLFKLTGLDKPKLSVEEEALASACYKEIMLRHIVHYTHFSAEDLYKTGFSKLLQYPEFSDPATLAGALSLFENAQQLRTLLRTSSEAKQLSCFIGDDLTPFSPGTEGCSVLAIPYRIHHAIVGAFALLGPQRLPYRKLFGILETASDTLSQALTASLYKFKISFRKPHPKPLDSIPKKTRHLLLEKKQWSDNGT